MTEQSNAAEQLPKDPTDLIFAVFEKSELVGQKVQCDIVQGYAELSQALSMSSENAAKSANEHCVAQITNETQGVTSTAGAENAKTAATENSQEANAERYYNVAQRENVLANSDGSRAQIDKEKAVVLDDMATIKTIVADIQQQQEVSFKEIEGKRVLNLTTADVEKEMKLANAVAEESGRSSSAHDLEDKLKLAATIETSAPKIA